MSADAWIWVAIVASALLAWAIKYAGHSIPESWLANPRVQRIATLVTVALLAALTATQAFTSGGHLVLDARVAAAAVAVIALMLRAPFIVVVAAAAAVAAGLRLLGWG